MNYGPAPLKKTYEIRRNGWVLLRVTKKSQISNKSLTNLLIKKPAKSEWRIHLRSDTVQFWCISEK